MKNKISAFTLALLILIMSVSLPVFAAKATTDRVLPRMNDEAGLIDAKSEKKLNSKLDALSEEWQFDFAALTVNSTNGKDIIAFSDDYFDYNGFGIGEDRSGVVLVISMNPRECYISARGEGTKYFDYDDCQDIIDEFYNELTSGNYAEVFNIFADSACNRLDEGRNGKTFSYRWNSFISDWQVTILVPIGIGIVLAIITIVILISGNKSVRKNPDAEAYQVAGSFVLSRSDDYFSHKNVSRTPKAESNSGGSIGSSGTHTSSSGASHSGGGRSF